VGSGHCQQLRHCEIACNFNLKTATAAKITVADVRAPYFLPVAGEINPDHIHRPGIFAKGTIEVGSRRVLVAMEHSAKDGPKPLEKNVARR
jgi:hypothetical protein